MRRGSRIAPLAVAVLQQTATADDRRVAGGARAVPCVQRVPPL